MDSDVVKCFNKALVSMQESKSAIVSKQKVVEITKAAMNAVRYFKHVVFILERYMVKCRPEYKISALYVMDSILRQAKKQYMHKDVFAPRFLVNLSNTINNVLDCDSNERLKVVRIINLWQAHQIFPEEAIYSLLQHCQASGLEVNPNRVELMVKGEKADMQIYQNQNLPTSAEKQNETTQRPQFIPTTPTVASISSLPNATGNISMGSGSHKSLDERLSQFSRQKLGFARSNSITTTPKTVESGPKTPPLEDQDMRRSISEKIVQNDSETAIINCLNGAEISQLLAKIGIQMNSTEAVERMQKIFNERVKEQMDIERRRAGNIKNLLSRDFDYSDEEEEAENRVGPMASPTFINVSKEKLLNVANSLITSDPSFQQELRNLAVLPVPAKQSSLQQFKMPDFSVPPPSIPRGAAYIQQPMPLTIPHHKEEGNNEFGDRHEVLSRKRTREWSRSPKRHTSGRHEQKSHRRDDERGYGRKRSRSRSGTPRYRERERDKTKEKHEREEREQIERERRRIGLPSRLKTDHVLIASRTLWFGRVPPLSSEKDIIDAVKEAGTPEKITIVGNRGCAYVTMADRKTAYKIMDRMANKIQVQKKNIKIDWATIIGLKEESRLVDYWDTKKGYCEIPFSKLPEGNIDNLVLDAWLVTESLPSHLKDRYTNIGLKENYKVKAANLPQNIALPPMPIATPTMQMVPTIFNPAILPVQMQLAAAIASIPPPNTNTTQSMAQFPLYRTTTPQMPSTPADGFSNVGFAGFNGSGRGRGGGEFRRGGRGRGGRGGFINAGYDNRGGYRGRGGGGYRGGINIRGNENRGRGNYQRYGGSHEHHSFSSFTSSQQSEVEGNDNVIPGLVDKSQQSGLDQLRESNIAEPKDKDNAPTVPPGVDKSDAPPGLDD